MQENLQIQVKITLKDLKAFSYAKAYSRIIDKVFLSFCFLMILLSVLVLFSSFVSGEGTQNIQTFINSLIIFSALTVFPGTLQYLTHRYNYKKSNLLSNPQCFELQDDGINISSPKGNSKLYWNDIFKVQELKPCFIIYLSPLKYTLIPRRCFHTQEELTIFRETIIQKIDKKKRKLKKYPLGEIAPDHEQTSNLQPTDGLTDDSSDSPLMEVNYYLTKKEHFAFHFQLYYTSPSGLILTILGVIQTGLYIINFSKNGSSNFDLLIFGLCFIILAPILIYINVNRQFNNDAFLKMKYSFKFYDDYFVLIYPAGQNRIGWPDLVKSKELKSGILLFLTTRLIHIIPKRAFADQAEFEKLKQLIKAKNTLKKSKP